MLEDGLEDGRIDGRTDGRIRAADPRPLLAVMTAARDGGSSKVPETGLGVVARGDPTQRVDLRDDNRRPRGDLRRLGRAVDRTLDQLSLFTGEVTRVARGVGTEGRPAGRAKVTGLSGSWRDGTEAVDTMASRLTAQVRTATATATPETAVPVVPGASTSGEPAIPPTTE